MTRRGLAGRLGIGTTAALLGALALATYSGCAPGSDTQTTSGTFGSGGSTSAGDGATTGKGATTGGGGDTFDPSGTGTGSTGTSGVDPGDACAKSSAEATLIPVNMFIMFDKSGSMADNNKWDNTSAALTGFFQDPASAGLRVALRFFPDNGCDGSACDIAACAKPQVALGPLSADGAPADTQEAELVAAVKGKSPGGGTPMSAALAGAESWAIAYQSAHPSEKTVVILVTDGEPNGCDENFTHIAKLASDAKAANSVLTYSVGLVGSNQAQMDQIAVAGGTTKGFFVGNGNAQADLLAALKTIQGSQVACQFQMPTSDNGDPVDPELVNVNYTPGDGSPMVTFGQVASAADCTGQKGGWFYDDPVKPTSITLCPTTCAGVQADAKAKIEILLGCATKPAT